MESKLLNKLRVLVACECSQIVCKAFRSVGCEAYSADIELCLGGHPEWHIVGDVSRILDGHCAFNLQTGEVMQIRRSWDIIIAHPPCTYLTKIGSPLMYMPDGSIDPVRDAAQIVGREFFLKCLNADAHYVCVENPVPMARANLPRCSTIINPYEFGEPWSKRTCLWLRNLPPLIPTLLNSSHREFVRTRRGSRARSMFFPKVAQAMAEQWTEYILHDINPFN